METFKKITLFTVISLASLAACSDKKSAQQHNTTSNENTSEVITPLDAKNSEQDEEEQTVFGITIDRAMNSISILTQNGDTLSFEYPESANPGVMARSHVGDTVTVKYVRIHDTDSLTAVFRGIKP